MIFGDSVAPVPHWEEFWDKSTVARVSVPAGLSLFRKDLIRSQTRIGTRRSDEKGCSDVRHPYFPDRLVDPPGAIVTRRQLY